MIDVQPAYLASGVAIGALAAVAAALQPSRRRRRGVELAEAAMVGTIVVVLATNASAVVVIGPMLGALLGWSTVRALDARSIPAAREVRGAWWLGAVGVAAAWVYLSVPDTEGAVLVGGVIVASFVPWAVGAWRGTRAHVALGVGALAGAVVAVGVAGASGHWTPMGWIVPKVVLIGALAIGAVATWRTRPPVTSEPGPPPP